MPPLSPRHIQVLELLDRGAPIKIIAAELDLSTSRVNQLIRELKERLAANHRFALVEAYRQMPGLGRNAPDNMAAPLPPLHKCFMGENCSGPRRCWRRCHDASGGQHSLPHVRR